MQPSEKAIIKGLEGEIQYVLPLFQRGYSWPKKQWETLCDDILEIAGNPAPDAGHFTGSILIAPSPVNGGGGKSWLLIDGQQRLTTISLFLVALRRLFRKLKDDSRAEEIQHRYLIDQYKKDDDRLKIRPQKADLPVYRALVFEGETPDRQHSMTKAVDFFASRLNKESVDDLDRLGFAGRILEKGLGRMKAVWIELGRDDNAYAVFESLNGKGLPLTQVDLLRNYSLMLFGEPERQEEASAAAWKRIDDQFPGDGDKKVKKNEEDFFRRWLMAVEGHINKKEVYEKGRVRFKQLFDGNGGKLEETLGEIADLAPFYQAFSQGGEKAGVSCALQQGFDRLRRIGSAQCGAIILLLARELLKNPAFEPEFLKCLNILESWFLRRDICGLTANAEENVCARLAEKLRKPEDSREVSSLIGQHLAEIGGSGRFPDDDEFERYFINQPLTDLAKKGGGGLSQFIFERIETGLREKAGDERAYFGKSELRPIFPRNPGLSWMQGLPPGDRKECTDHAETFGNLAFFSKDAPACSGSFPDTRRALKRNDDYFANRDILEAERWDWQAIEDRGGRLFEIVRKLWPDYAKPYRTEESPAT